ncbi:MAG TPA: enoyl-CoA hydratase-related protein [Gaiellaceae bacterium]|nr:enoyl-CoA hydratase-related protein [Gaiellaceae bacterium]
MGIDVERDAGTAVVTVNRPEAMNAIDLEHAEALRDRLTGLAGDEDARVVVLTGAGDRAFVAGADIKYMQALGVLEARRWAALGQACANLLETMPKPTIAAINGFALGGGCELALACDIRLASRAAKLGQPEINLGAVPGWGGSQRLPRETSLAYAKELIFTGRTVDADEALARGLVNAVCGPDELLPKARELAETLAAKSPLALAYAKEATNLAMGGGDRSSLATEERLFAMLFASEDQKEGMAAFVEKREPRFRGR